MSGTALADAVKHTVMMNMAPIFQEQFAVGYLRQQCRSLNSVVAMVLLFPQLWSKSDLVIWKWNRCGLMTTRCKSTLSRKARGRAKANTKARKEIARTTQATRAIQTSTRARTVAELDIGRTTAGDQVEEPTTVPPVSTATQKGKNHKKGKGKGKQVNIVETNQSSETASTVSYPSQTEYDRSSLVQSKRGTERSQV